ncbi:DNA polymerase III, delta subunit [Alkaliphilus metalliredigens QYMF]|uniref:DNA polymerase III subunit delta n=1 Tax=Alkaliphilus metalliredigens (strain QYMF) TaxID=293826 RepID=A6TSM9_ALKMQ|nr:DNA polymerase III subunit delta [Alkaliphilus metalliredigens]ABR49197.1 DNA polymerase III, delta subunit [Alkaliphilus metalliredigens QYMF]
MSYKEIVASINKNQIENLYLLYGEESYLMENIAQKLKKKVVSSGFEELNFSYFEGKDITVEKLIDACETLPFMAEEKLVLIKNFDAFQGKRKSISEVEEEELIHYIAKLPRTTCLVFYGTTSVDSRKKIVKAVKKHGKHYEFQKLKELELEKWISKKLKQATKTIERRELSLLTANLDYLGRNTNQSLYDVDNEINKLVAFMGKEERVIHTHIEAIMTNNLQNDIFKLLDAIGNRNGREALRRLHQMVTEGEPIMRVLFTMSNQIKNILSIKLLVEDGYSSKMAADKISVHPYVASKCEQQSRGFRIEALIRIMQMSLEIDKMIKTGRIDERIGIELLVVEMCKTE